MTNGEKFQQIFAVSQVDECDLNVYAWLPSHEAIEIPLEWWNANCSEIPTGSTDCISRQEVIDLMMQKWGENFSGDDAMQESIDAIRVMPSVTPQEPFKPMVEIDLDYVIKQKYIEREVLDKIRGQIKDYLRGVEITLEVLVENDPLRPKMEGAKDTLEECLDFIDKAETEE